MQWVRWIQRKGLQALLSRQIVITESPSELLSIIVFLDHVRGFLFGGEGVGLGDVLGVGGFLRGERLLHWVTVLGPELRADLRRVDDGNELEVTVANVGNRRGSDVV